MTIPLPICLAPKGDPPKAHGTPLEKILFILSSFQSCSDKRMSMIQDEGNHGHHTNHNNHGSDNCLNTIEKITMIDMIHI